jgi:N-acetyl-anhydromuramyl-L-alanine amidase AmpD
VTLLSARPAAPLALALALASCAEPLTRDLDSLEAPISDAFARASADWDVPVEVLAGVAATETNLMSVVAADEFDGRPPRHGVMGIPDGWIADAALLTGLDAAAIRTELDANVQGAAALLADHAGDIDRADVGAWAPAVAWWSDSTDEAVRAAYVHDEVFARIRAGVVAEGVSVDPWSGDPDYEPSYRDGSGNAQRSYAIWRPSPNHSARPAGVSPTTVIIHTCEGAYNGCWSWLANSASGVSAHYVVNESGSEITQLVNESRKAWHIAASYDCSLNGNTDCSRNGQPSNNFTIGVEHAGFANQSSFQGGQLAASARLVCDIARSNGIPRDAYHIVGHGKLQPYNRIDPGPNWPWTQYLTDVRAACGDAASSGTGSSGGTSTPPSAAPPAGAPGEIVIDSNNAANLPGRAMVEVSTAWTSSQSVQGYYNTGYFWRRTGSSADAAWFRFLLDSPGCYAVDAWWPSATDRAAGAPFVVFDADGAELGRRAVDQRRDGGQWNPIGTFTFQAGWGAVALSRWIDESAVVVADAVRVRPATGCTAAPTPPTPALFEAIIDSDVAANTGATEFEASAAWATSSETPGYYGSGYRFHDTSAGSDPASFWFHLDAPKRLVVEARWTAGPNRSPGAPFLVFGPTDQLIGAVWVDQRVNHGTWVRLGTWDIPAGWNRVALSHWAVGGDVVVADAVRVREVQ